MFIPPNTLLQSSKVGLTSRRIAAASMTLIFAATAAFAQTCPADRTPLEMAGQTLCWPTAAMPTIHRDENGAVNGLTWSTPERFPSDLQLPPGTFYLIVEVGQRNEPSLEETESSDLPEMRQSTNGLATHLFPSFQRFHPSNTRLNGQPFTLECKEAVEPKRHKQGGQDCEIYSMVAAGIRVHVFLGTVDWVGPAWPRLDKHWAETWPPYLDDLGTGISNLLSIQQ